MTLFEHTSKAKSTSDDPTDVDVDLLGEFLQMTAAPKWGYFFTGPSVRVESAEGTFGPRVDRGSSAVD